MKYLLSLSLLFSALTFQLNVKVLLRNVRKILGMAFMPTGQSSNTELVPEKSINL